MTVLDVLVVDKTKARFLSLRKGDSERRSPALRERRTILNERHALLQGKEKIDTRRGGDHPRVGRPGNQPNLSGHGARNGFSDAENALDAEAMRLFARDLCHELVDEAHKLETRELVVCADPKMMGHLRPHLNAHLGKSLTLHEVNKDFANMRDSEIQAALTQLGLVEPRSMNWDIGWPGNRVTPAVGLRSTAARHS